MSKKSKSSDKKLKRVKHVSKNSNGTRHTKADNQKRTLIEGEERKLHEEIIDRRVTGGVSLSKEDIAEAYDRALKQWQGLPGSIVRPPTDITLPSKKRPKSSDTVTSSEHTVNDADNGGKQD